MYTIQLCFSQNSLNSLTTEFQKVDSPILKKGDRPHLSLSVFELEEEKENNLLALIDDIANRNKSFVLE